MYGGLEEVVPVLVLDEDGKPMSFVSGGGSLPSVLVLLVRLPGKFSRVFESFRTFQVILSLKFSLSYVVIADKCDIMVLRGDPPYDRRRATGASHTV